MSTATAIQPRLSIPTRCTSYLRYRVTYDSIDNGVQVLVQSHAEAVELGAEVFECPAEMVVAGYVSTITIPDWKVEQVMEELAEQDAKRRNAATEER